MEYVLTAVFIGVVIWTLLKSTHHDNSIELEVEPMDEEVQTYSDEDIIIHFKVSMFDALYSLGYFKETDGTEQLEARDRKTHMISAYMRDDFKVVLVKQQQPQGGK